MLWLATPNETFFRDLLAQNDPTVCGIRDAAFAAVDEAMANGQDDEQHAIAELQAFCAAAHRLGHPKALEYGLQICIERMEGVTSSDLGRAAVLLNAAVLADAALDADPRWRPADDRFANAIAGVLQSLRTKVDKGNPHQAGNNWWAVTHSGVIHGARVLELLGQPQDDLIAWAWGRLQPFTHHFGDAGLYHDGLGYQRYTCAHLIPAIYAMARRNHFDPGERFPWLKPYSTSLLATACTRWNKTDGPENWGSALSWNDAGTGWGDSSDLPLAALTTSEEEHSALKTLFDRLYGHASPKPTWNNTYSGVWLFLNAYPYHLENAEPDAVLRKELIDNRQGLCIWRSAYGSGDEQMLGFYAKHTQVGGHKQADAGSVRYTADGHDWIIGGGQARPNAEYQSVCFPAGGQKGDASHGTGWLMYEAAGDQAPIWAADLRKTSRAYHERWITAHQDGHALSILDLIDEHSERPYHWNITIPAYLEVEIKDNSVHLQADDGTRAVLSFLCQQPDEMVLDKLPDSQRTYSGGGTVHYPGNKLIRSTFNDCKHAVIHAVLTTAKADQSLFTATGDPRSITLTGDTTITWDRPYEHGLSPDWTPERGGSTAPNPAGVQ